jgi:tetratricopeptide (TPR) repeat protein
MVGLLGGCSWLSFWGDDDPNRYRGDGKSVAQVVDELPELELPQGVIAKPTREEVMAAYNRVYGMIPNARENFAVGKRLADLHMSAGEDRDVEGREEPYQPAVDLYETLLLESEGADNQDEILYQLARAYDLAGNTDQALAKLDRLIGEYEDSPYVPEARFRRAELQFSGDDYRAAAADYRYVVDLGDATPYFLNASYMLGWSEFKRSRFDEGLEQFFNVADAVLAKGDDVRTVDRELLTDTLRVVTLALAYLDGPQTLAEEMRKRDKPSWQYLVYEHLADDYFEKERYLDSVQTWQTFIEHNSLDQRAPAAHLGMIKTLMDAGFPSEVLPKKKEFVERYGVYSEFWTVHDLAVRETYLKPLHQYLSELAKVAHADAQTFDAEVAKGKRKAKDGERVGLYMAAAMRYEEMVVTFPKDPRTAEYLFLQGETLTEADDPARAVAAYQRVVHEFPEFERANEAGYATILGLGELVKTSSPKELELWQRLEIDAQIEFAMLFSGDERAPAVQTDAANSMYALGHMAEAIDLASNLLAEWPDVDQGLRKTALLILGHGHFELDDFVQAEASYHELLTMTLTDEERSKIDERLLAAVYKQGEAAEAGEDVDLAVHHYLRIAALNPVAPLAIQGHFDAIAVIEGAGRVAEAAELLADFRQKYPGHELANDIDVRLASMYEKTEDWAQAAVEYVGLSQNADDEDVRRQSLYRAAELYLEMDNVTLAIEHFRDYAHTYKKPWDLGLEAMHNMDLLYQRTGEGDKRRFWLNKKIALHREMGAAATARATHLAAQAQYVFAEDERQRYVAIELSHPLQRSLKKKQKALTKTLKAYEAVAGYEVAEFTTASTFEIGDLYTALSKAIMASDRPKNLSELELEQYEILLEEQAFPFEEQAISLHEINMRRSWDGIYDDWVKKSFAELARLMPGRFDKREVEAAYAQAIH